MFMNSEIARKHGDKVERDALANGSSPRAAKQLGNRAAKDREKELDDWTRKNVGLD